jgi:hypothetical protein
VGYASESARQELRTLAAMSVAKHETGAKKPNQQLLNKVAESMERDEEEAPSATRDAARRTDTTDPIA